MAGLGNAGSTSGLQLSEVDTSAELRAILGDESGSGVALFGSGALGTPSSGTLTSCTGLPITTGVSGMASGVSTYLASTSGDVTISGAGAAAIGASKVLPSMVEADLLRYQDTQLTHAQLSALLGTDVVLVTNPGSNRTVIVHAVYLYFDVTTTGYTVGAAALAVGYGGDGANIMALTEVGFLDQATDQARVYYLGGVTAAPANITPVTNVDVVLRATVADMTDGNAANTLSVRTWYSIVDNAAFT